MKYRPEIDGLRAVAVIPVILFHAGFSLFSGGYVGVDVFFVISGYLITSILLRDLELKRFSIAYFYERRARRILPALYLVMFVSAVMGWLFMLPNEFSAFSLSAVSVSLFFSNVFFWKQSGYFGPAAETNPLLHTWSLAVEEQFYVFFPLFLWALFYWRKQIIVWAIALVAIVSFALTEFIVRFVSVSGAAAFFLAPTRAWELLVGSLCAFVLTRQQVKQNNWLTFSGLLLISIAILSFDDKTPFPSVYTFLPVVGAALIILFAGIETMVGKCLSHKYLVGIGLISYSAYLWHQPLFAFARLNNNLDLSNLKLTALILATLVLAYFSWRFVEVPFRDKTKVSRRAIFSFSGIGAAALIFFGVHSHTHQGYESFWLQGKSEAFKKTYELVNSDPKTSSYGLNENGVQDNGSCVFSVQKFGAAEIDRLRKCYDTYGPGVAVLGDSHAIDLFGVVYANSNEPFLFGLTMGGCSANETLTTCYLDKFAYFAKDYPEYFDFILYEQAAFRILDFTEDTLGVKMIESTPLTSHFPEVAVNEKEAKEVVEYLRGLSEYLPVLWFGPRVEPRISKRTLLSASCYHVPSLRPGQREFYAELDQYIGDLVQTEQNITYLSQNDSYDFEFPSDLMTCTENFWADGDHLSMAGEIEFGKRFDIIGYANKKFNLE